MVVYEVTGPLEIEEVEIRYGEGDGGFLTLLDLRANGKIEELENAIKKSEPELAPYISENSIIYGLIDSIEVGIDDKGSLTKVKAKRELNGEELKELKEYIEGQFSDGWGEGFEQCSFSDYEDEIELYDEDDEEYYEEIGKFETYAKFWTNSRSYSLKVEKK